MILINIIQLLIKQIQFNVPNTLNSIFLFIRNINFGNSIISRYQTNFNYIPVLYSLDTTNYF